MRRMLPWKLVSRIVGLLLLVAAVLKARGLGFDTMPGKGIFSGPEFKIGLVELEIALAVWLLSGKTPVGAWLVSILAFAAFAGASFYMGWVGQSSCGCFGSLVSISPWATLVLDLLVLAALLLGRPDLKPLWHDTRRTLGQAAWPTLYGALGIALISSLLIALATVGFGSLAAALAVLRGERVSIQPRLADVGTGQMGEDREITLQIANWTEQSIRLIGGTADCSCTVLNDLPVTIPPKKALTLSVNIRLTGKPGIFTRKAGFVVDDDGLKKIAFVLTGRIQANEKMERAHAAR